MVLRVLLLEGVVVVLLGGGGVVVVASLQFSQGGQTPSKGDGHTFPVIDKKKIEKIIFK